MFSDPVGLDIVFDAEAPIAWSATLTADGQTVSDSNVSLDTAVFGALAKYDAIPPTPPNLQHLNAADGSDFDGFGPS